MIPGLKAAMQNMVQGLPGRYQAGNYSTAEQVARIHVRCRQYRLSGKQGRILLVASTDLMGAAFEFVIDLAKHTNSSIEVLYFKPDDRTLIRPRTLLRKLGDLTRNFQITFVSGEPRRTVSNFCRQRRDTVAVVSSACEPFIDELRPAIPFLRHVTSFNFPDVVIVGCSFLA